MRKRQLNWKLLAWLVGTAGVSAGAVHFAHSAQMSRHAQTLLDQAAHEEADGRLDHEAEYLKRYLTFNGGDTDALARYGIAAGQDCLVRRGALARCRRFRESAGARSQARRHPVPAD